MKVALLLKRINQLEGPFKSRLLIRARQQMHRPCITCAPEFSLVPHTHSFMYTASPRPTLIAVTADVASAKGNFIHCPASECR